MVSSGVEAGPQALLQAAWTALRAGQATQAVALCETILRDAPSQPDALLLRGMLHHKAGEGAQAERAIERALVARPGFPYGHFIQGVHRLDGKRPGAAVLAFRRALELDPNFAPAWAALAAALRQIDKPADALDACARAAAVMPNDLTLACIRADALADLGRIDEARAIAEQLVAHAPADPRGWRSLSHVLERGADADGALAAVERWRALEPGAVAVDAARGRLLDLAGRHHDALVVLEAAVARAPGDADVRVALAAVQLAAAARAAAAGTAPNRQLEQAVDHLQRAQALSPDDRAVATRLGNALELLGRHEQALACYEQALALDPERLESLTDVGRARLLRGEATVAAGYFERVLARDPTRVEVMNELGLAALSLGGVERAVACFETVVARSGGAGSFSNLLLALQYRDIAPAALLERHRDYGAAVARPAPAVHANGRDAERALRIGYLSADFGRHQVGLFILPVIAAHDRDRYAVHCYSNRVTEDDVTARIRGHARLWHTTAGLDDAALDARIRADGIDVLVDLGGHTAGNRLTALARKPAPVQATWLGYPGTTGLSAIDFRVTDAIADPPGTDGEGVEAPVRLPHGFHCYVPAETAPEITVRPDGPVTFGSFNNLSKISDAVIAVWGRVLAGVPDARLIVKASALADAETRARCQAAFGRVGVAPDRVSLIATTAAWRDHMGQYGQVDVALDAFPYNGTTTTCDALWMGVPVITLRGDRHAGRVGASLLSQLGLSELIAETPDAYVAKAVELAHDRDRLAVLRTALRPRLAAAPLGDPGQFTRTLEDGYREMWRRWCAKA